jgi:hypothetical protein
MIKRLIKINHTTKQKIAEMCVVLLPRVGYARVTNSGLVILKRHWWSLCSQRIPVTDVIIKYLPMSIGKLLCKKDKREVYIAMFNDRVATIVSLTKYIEKMDLLDYVYKEYAKACMITEPDYIIESYSEPIAVKLHTFNINSVIKSMKYKETRVKISDQVEKLKSRIHLPKNVKNLFINVRIATV